jgi:hypothetical protein
VWGAVRLVPLIRDAPLADLRLGLRAYGEAPAVVTLDGDPDDPRLIYAAYIPFGMIASWTDDGAPAAMCETWLGTGADRGARGREIPGLRRLLRMHKREGARRLRLLPLHLAMDGFLGLCFGGPDIAWDTWSHASLRHGLSPRWEWSAPGRAIPDLGDALRLFEIHDRQSGVLVFVGDALASAFVVSHPDDYRAMHASLIEDFYGTLLLHYGWHYRDVPAFSVTLRDADVDDLDGLERALAAERCRTVGRYTLLRFMTAMNASPGFVAATPEAHIGEAMLAADGTLAYLKTYRLSDAQRTRAHLLTTLATHDWDLGAAAAALGWGPSRLRRRLTDVGLGGLLRVPSPAHP